MNDKSAEKQDYETLGENVIPSRYVLNFRPDFKTFKYEATEVIEANVKKPTREISINAAELKINDAGVVSAGQRQNASVKEDKKRQRITLKFAKPVKGNVDIQIEFTGINNDRMYGFYRSKYMHGDEEGYILSSQFEAANARNAFPCFDEPAFKAVFDVAFTVDKKLECISNMPIKNVLEIDKNTKEVRFHETPTMSSYLLYLGVGNYDYVEGKAGKTIVRVVTTPGRKDLAKLPLKYAIDSIKFYEKYFGIEYPLPKVDFIAIPDFAAGAMENWGAITFREVALLADEKTSVAGKQRIAEVIAHELAHQWFGDLVTMKWWNDLWLNESFATFMASKANDAVFPQWNVKIEYLRDTIATAFAADQLKSTHPISVAVRAPSDIDQLFDEISYEKGGTVLNMIEHYAGEDVFRDGLHIYLKSNSYSNATKYDLWRAIDAAAKKKKMDVDAYGVAGYWIDSPGYPMVDAKRNGGKVELKQSRYFLLRDLSDKGTWPIPINYAVSGDKGTMLLKGKSGSIKANQNDWVKLNYGQNGLYRVRYDADDLEMLGKLIADGKLSPADAWGVEQDVFAMARSGRSKVDDYMNFVNKYCLDAQYPLNANVLGHLSGLHDLLYYYDNARIKKLTLKYSDNLISRLGWSVRKNESAHDTLLRPSALMRSAMLGNKETVNKAVDMFYSFVKGKTDIDTNIRSAVYSISAWSEGGKVFDTLKERYEKEKVPEEKIRFLRAISMFSDQKLLRESLEFSMSKKVRLQDSYIIPAICSANPVGKPIMLNWTEKKWKSLNKIYASGTHMIGRYIDNLDMLDTKKDKEEVIRFFGSKENKRDDIKHALGNAVEMIEANIRFIEANGSK
jgi:tricorn protease interacting factor F2/3